MNGTQRLSKTTMTAINKAVADYQEGLARIDREFDALSNRIEQSILDLSGDAANHRSKLNEEAMQRLAYESKQASGNREKRTLNWQSIFSREWEKIAAETGR